jgi:hypothetical protein
MVERVGYERLEKVNVTSFFLSSEPPARIVPVQRGGLLKLIRCVDSVPFKVAHRHGDH